MREGALELTRALDFSVRFCNAVDHAHRAGFLHRDRGRQMLGSESEASEGHRLRGLRAFSRSPRTATRSSAALEYMAPEQSRRAYFSSDVYSVGRDVYQMMTGRCPTTRRRPRSGAVARGDLGDGAASEEKTRSKSESTTSSVKQHGKPNRQHDTNVRPTVAERQSWRSATRRFAAAAVPGDGPLATETDHVRRFQSRLKARETPQASFCWHCRKPLQARTAKCRSARETQS